MWSSFLGRLLRLVGRPQLVVPDELEAPALDAPRRPTPRASAEAWLADLVTRLAAGDAAAVNDLPVELGRRVELLLEAGHPRLAAEWLAKVATAAPAGPAADEVRARAAHLYLERGDAADALPHLEALTRSPSHAAAAHFHLGEHHQRQGDPARALRHFEAALAVDVDHPNARVRAEALRAGRPAALAATATATATVTIAGVDGQAATAGARYRLVAELGRGASGAVYRARDVELERDVAIKLLHPHLGAAVGRFFAEARVAAALRHPGLVAVLDLDEEHRRIVMELATGGTLRERLRAGPLPLLEALEAHAALLSALAAAHRRGVVHRDLKPANLLFRRPGTELVLGDFGVAQLGVAPGREAVGTLQYMAPEQRRGAGSPAVDVFAAGVLLHEMLTGHGPAGLGVVTGLTLPGERVPTPLAGPLGDHLAALTAPEPGDRPPAADAALAAARLRERARAGDDPLRFAAELAQAAAQDRGPARPGRG